MSGRFSFKIGFKIGKQQKSTSSIGLKRCDANNSQRIQQLPVTAFDQTV